MSNTLKTSPHLVVSVVGTMKQSLIMSAAFRKALELASSHPTIVASPSVTTTTENFTTSGEVKENSGRR